MDKIRRDASFEASVLAGRYSFRTPQERRPYEVGYTSNAAVGVDAYIDPKPLRKTWRFRGDEGVTPYEV